MLVGCKELLTDFIQLFLCHPDQCTTPHKSPNLGCGLLCISSGQSPPCWQDTEYCPSTGSIGSTSEISNLLKNWIVSNLQAETLTKEAIASKKTPENQNSNFSSKLYAKEVNT